jgi:hypothetical protein
VKFIYEDLSPRQFEDLVILICQRLLGISVQGFAEGRDGGRDAKFIGTAELWPSTAAPWEGTTIIQAKHTNGHNRHFAETDFFNPSEPKPNSAIGKEIPRIIKLRKSGELDHYALFANRRLTGGVEAKIVEHISKTCNIPKGSISLFGLERLESLLVNYPDIPAKAKLDPVDSPLIVSPNDLAEVIQALAASLDGLFDETPDPPTPRTSYEEKNRLNNMTPDYANEQRKRYLKETGQIKSFLSWPENEELLRKYESIVEEFNIKIICHRSDYQTFDQVLEYLLDLLFGRDPVLKQIKHRRLTRVMIFYMYWTCDIGKESDA